MNSELIQMMGSCQAYIDEINLIFDIFKTCNDTYDDFYEDSREAYVSFVNFAPSVKSQMQEVDKQL